MKFGAIPVDEAEGAILAHGARAGSVSFSKGRLLSASDIAALREAGVEQVFAARIEQGDVGEDEAAGRIASSLSGAGFSARTAATGRVNLYADAAGVFIVDAGIIGRINAVDPAITIATLRHHIAVAAGQMVATVKIIPFAVGETLVEKAAAICQDGEAMAVHAFSARRIGLIQTRLEGTRDKVLDKTVRVMAERLSRSASLVAAEERIAHDVGALADTIREQIANHDLVIVFGASATSDADDVIPSAIARAGGDIIRVGMPVDPGNLITLGQVDGKPVIGAPGCARSPRENGFDWVLDRIIAGLAVGGLDIEAMGVGGLLAEIPARPRPRETAAISAKPDIHAVLLAAGRSSRMGGPNKLLAMFDGVTLIRRMADTLIAAGLDIAVVTGHQSGRIEAVLDGLEIAFTHNPDFADGLSSSLKAGVRSLAATADGAMIVLADMPGLSAADIRSLCDAFQAAGGQSIVRATHGGKRGNPVILPRQVFAMIEHLTGDTGARGLIEAGYAPVVDVEIGRAASMDVDTPELLSAAGGVLPDGDAH